MGLLAWIVIGLIAGALARLVLPGDQPGGCVMTMVVGIIGALIGGFIMSLLGYGGVTGINLYSILVATLGAVVLLVLYGLLVR
ncbi:MAG: GlsB/YeaQ/YmgE family stress response membrane protein [Actinobacteria bacterium]|nr:MAG: GlsB/YeaQ/YmgE family stress response membrane protein [Actinomycetota bacterium]